MREGKTLLRRLLICVLLIVPVAVSSCGYALVGRGSSLPPGIKSVEIPQFKNLTNEPDIDTIITRAVIDGFIKDGRLEVKSKADSALKGKILGYELRPVAYDDENNATEYVVSLTLKIVHTEKGTQKVLAKQTFNTEWRYQVDQSIFVAESLRLDAVKEAAERASDSIISIVIESF